MDTLQTYNEIKEKVEKAQQTKDQAAGALSQVMKRLKNEFGCVTLKQAKKKLKELQSKEEELQGEFEQAVEEFEGNWSDGSN